MKTILFYLILVSLANFSFGQNWSLINQNRTVFFQHSDSAHVTNTIFVDSVETIGANTNYYIGYAFKHCDTCQNGDYYYRYAEELLGFNAQDDAVNNQFLLDDNIIKQHSLVSDSWIFSPGITATTINKIEVSILGVLDSIKTITLTTNDTILISKNYGVIRYPDFENSGKYYEMVGYHEGQDSYGEYLPNFWRTYDFNVGDLLSYRFETSSFDYFEHGKATVEILSKTISVDTIQFSYRRLGTNQYYNTQTGGPFIYSSTNYISSVNLINDPNGIENCSGISPNNGSNSSLFFAGDFGYSPISSTVGAYIHIDPVFGLSVKQLPLTTIGDSLYSPIIYNDAPGFGLNTGLLVSAHSGFSPNHYDSLVGTVINGDTLGTIYDFPEDLGIKQSLDQEGPFFYPNPARDQITIQANISNLKIYSTLGQLVMETEPFGQLVDIRDLTEGVYLIQATDEMGGTFSTKLIVR